MTRYFGFAFSASMLPSGLVNLRKQDLTVEQVREMIPSCEMCLNPFHRATVDAACSRFDLPISIPDRPARISLGVGDSVVVMQVRGLPRLQDRREYTDEEIENANFSFMEITVV